MQQLHNKTNGEASPVSCVKELLSVVPTVMRFVRHRMRSNRRVGLTVPQFRALVFVSHSDDSTLSALADHLGMSLPAVSRMVDLLVKRGLMDRRIPPDNRRRVSLSLTKEGLSIFQSALADTEMAMARQLEKLSSRQLEQVSRSMKILTGVFAPENCPLDLPRQDAGGIGVSK